MAQPATYNRQYSFTNFQALNPTTPLPAIQLDLELNTVKITLDQIEANLALIQRDDGQLASASVGLSQLKSEVQVGLNTPTPWVTAHAYALNDSVFFLNAFYRSLIAHTSGTFATDLASSKWLLIADFGAATSLSDFSRDISFSGVINITPGSDQNDYNPTGFVTANAILSAPSIANANITGLTGGRKGREVVWLNQSANTLTLKDSSGLSTAANRFSFGGSDIVLGNGQSATTRYDDVTARWYSVANTAGVTVGNNSISAVKLAGSAVPLAGMINGTLVESHAGSAVTFALKTLAGTDPTATDPVIFAFRDVTAATGDFLVRSVTAALSVTISSGSTMGFSNGVAGRLWLGALDNAGAVELFAVNCLSGSDIYPLGQFAVVTTTAEGGAGASDSAQVPYSTTARTAKPYVVIGYASYETGVATAGSWNNSPTRLQLFGHGVPLPGTTISVARATLTTVTTGTTVLPHDNTIPQNTEGDQYLSKAITPTSAANLLEVKAQLITATNNAGDYGTAALFQDSTANALAVGAAWQSATSAQIISGVEWAVLAGVTVATTFKIRSGVRAAATMTVNGEGGTQTYGGVSNSYLVIRELQA